MHNGKFSLYRNDTRMNGGMSMLLAEVASCQMEYKYLAYLTGREEFFTTVGSGV